MTVRTNTLRMRRQEQPGDAAGLGDATGANSVHSLAELPPAHRHTDLRVVPVDRAGPQVGSEEELNLRGRHGGERIHHAKRTYVAGNEPRFLLQLTKCQSPGFVDTLVMGPGLSDRSGLALSG